MGYISVSKGLRESIGEEEKALNRQIHRKTKVYSTIWF